MTTLRTPLLALLLLAGCPRKPDPTDACYQVEGGGDYAVLQDAIDAAEAGDTIRVCDGIWNDTAVIRKPLTLRGGGHDDSLLVPQDESAPIIVDGAEVTIGWMGISGLGTTMIVRNGGIAHLQDLDIRSAGGYGIHVMEESSVYADDLYLEEAVLGGIRVDGGLLELRNSEVRRSNSFGVQLNLGADAVIEDSLFEAIYYTGNASYLFSADGIGVQATRNSDVKLARNEFLSIGVASVQVESSVLAMEGDTIDGSFACVLTLGSLVELSGVSITNCASYGGYFRTSQVSLYDVDVAIDPATSSGAADTSTGSRGVIGPDSDFVVRGGTISGGNGGGLHAYALSPTSSVTVDVQNLVLENNARVGLAVEQGELTAQNVIVRDTRNRSTICDGTAGEPVCNYAVYTRAAQTSWTGGEIADNAGIGVRVDQGYFEGKGLSLSANAGGGARVVDGGLLLDGATLTGNGGGFAVYADGTYGAIVNSLITGTTGDRLYNLVTEEGLWQELHHDDAEDLRVVGGTWVVQDSTFAAGVNGIAAVGGILDVIDTTFGGYAREIVQTEGGQVNLTRLSLADTGPAVACADGTATIKGLSVDGVHGYTATTDFLLDGEALTTETVARLPGAVNGSACQLYLDDVTLANADGEAVAATDSIVEIDNFTATGVTTTAEATAAITLSWATRAPEAILEDVLVETVGSGAGLSLAAAPELEPGYVTLDRVKVVGAASGLRLDGVSATVNDLVVTSPTAEGLTIVGGTQELSGVVVESAGTWGMVCDTVDPPAFGTCDVTLDGASGAALGCDGCGG